MSLSPQPTLSVGLPVYNGEEFLAEAMRSILEQTYEDFELIVCDNQSTDATPDIVESFASDDKRVRFVRNRENIGANANFNKVVALAEGRLFRWAAHDDICQPTYFERCVALLDADATAVAAHSLTEPIDSTGLPLIPIKNGFLTRDGLLEPAIDPRAAIEALRSPDPVRRYEGVVRFNTLNAHVFSVIRREALLGTRLQLPFYGADKVFLAELALLGRVETVEQPLWQRRAHPKTSNRMSKGKDRGAWAGVAGFYPYLMLRNYIAVVNNSDTLTKRQKLECLGVLARKVTEPRKLRQLLLPGPFNYLGWGA